MTSDNFFDYLIPIVIMAVYFLTSLRKKKTAPTQYQEEVRKEPLPPILTPKRVQTSSDLPPIRRKTAVLHSKIEEVKIDSAINARDFSTSITEERASSLVSNEMLKHIDLDQAYAQNTKKEFSRARKLLTSKTSLRDAFLLQEILKRPHE